MKLKDESIDGWKSTTSSRPILSWANSFSHDADEIRIGVETATQETNYRGQTRKVDSDINEPLEAKKRCGSTGEGCVGCRLVLESVTTLSRSLECMQGLFLKEIRRLIEKLENGKPCNHKNKAQLDVPYGRVPTMIGEHFFGDAQSNGLPIPSCGDNKDASIDVTSPMKMESGDGIPIHSKKRKDRSSRTKKCIWKPLKFPKIDSKVIPVSLENRSRMKKTLGHKHKTKDSKKCRKPIESIGLTPEQPIDIPDSSGGNLQLTIPTRSRLMDLLFDHRLPKYTTLVSILGQKATRSQVRTLRPKQWIHGEVINCYSGLLTSKARRERLEGPHQIWYLPSDVQQFILSKIICGEVLYTNYLTASSFGGPLHECKKICVPMNWNNKHWYMATIDMTKGIVWIYDSAPGNKPVNDSRENDVRIVCGMIQEALVYGFPSEQVSDISNFIISRPDWCPKQDNGHDCGLYLCKFMQYCNEMKPGFKINVVSNEARVSLAFDIFLDPANDVRHLCVYDFAGLENLFV